MVIFLGLYLRKIRSEKVRNQTTLVFIGRVINNHLFLFGEAKNVKSLVNKAHVLLVVD